MLVEAMCWGGGLTVASILRLDLEPRRAMTGGLGLLILVAVGAQALIGMVLGLYHRRRWRYGSFEEVAGVATSAVLTTSFLLIIDFAAGDPHLVPIGAVIAGGYISLVAMAATRYVARVAHDLTRRPSEAGTVPLLVFGAGQGGVQILGSLLRDPAAPYVPVGLLDDDPAKRNLRIMGVQVAAQVAGSAPSRKPILRWRLDADVPFLQILDHRTRHLVTGIQHVVRRCRDRRQVKTTVVRQKHDGVGTGNLLVGGLHSNHAWIHMALDDMGVGGPNPRSEME